MDPQQAQQLALELMRHHGVTNDGWEFRWSHGKKQLGCAQIRKRKRSFGRVEEEKTIKLSRHLVALNDEDEVKDTILHEIAHAIAGIEHGHDGVWKAVCRRIGAKPQRLAGREVNVVEPTYVIVCGVCEEVLAKRFRRIRKDRLARSYCQHCGPTTKGKLIFQTSSNDTAPSNS